MPGTSIRNSATTQQHTEELEEPEESGELEDPEVDFLMQLAQNTMSLQFTITEGQTMEDVLTNRKLALLDLTELKRKKTVAEANQKLAEIQEKIYRYPKFVRYITYQFKHLGAYWLNCNMEYQELTNNYVEAFHNILKTVYFERRRIYRMDRVIHVLMEKVVLYHQNKHTKHCIYPFKRGADKSEQLSKSEAKNIPDSDIELMVKISFNEIKVKSFTGSHFYKIEKDALSIHYCSCPRFQNSIDWCKHLFLLKRAQKIRGNRIEPVEQEEDTDDEEFSDHNPEDDIEDGDDEYVIEQVDDLEMQNNESEEENGIDFNEEESEIEIQHTIQQTHDTQENIITETSHLVSETYNTEENEYTIDDLDIENLFQLPSSQFFFTETGIAVSVTQERSNSTNDDENRSNLDTEDAIAQFIKKFNKYGDNFSKKCQSQDQEHKKLEKEFKRSKTRLEKLQKQDNYIQQKLIEAKEIQASIQNSTISEEEKQQKLVDIRQCYYSALPNNNRRQLRY